MARDSLFDCDTERPQLEFVVDNSAVAGLANGTLAINSDLHAKSISNIRRHTCRIYRRHDHKALYMDPVDWRPREWNTGADYLANYALATGETGGNLTTQSLKKALETCIAIQFYTDGGFARAIGGSIGVQCIGYHRERGNIQRRCVGYAFAFMGQARSAFAMELKALETALEYIAGVL